MRSSRQINLTSLKSDGCGGMMLFHPTRHGYGTHLRWILREVVSLTTMYHFTKVALAALAILNICLAIRDDHLLPNIHFIYKSQRSCRAWTGAEAVPQQCRDYMCNTNFTSPFQQLNRNIPRFDEKDDVYLEGVGSVLTIGSTDKIVSFIYTITTSTPLLNHSVMNILSHCWFD